MSGYFRFGGGKSHAFAIGAEKGSNSGKASEPRSSGEATVGGSSTSSGRRSSSSVYSDRNDAFWRAQSDTTPAASVHAPNQSAGKEAPSHGFASAWTQGHGHESDQHVAWSSGSTASGPQPMSTSTPNALQHPTRDSPTRDRDEMVDDEIQEDEYAEDEYEAENEQMGDDSGDLVMEDEQQEQTPPALQEHFQYDRIEEEDDEDEDTDYESYTTSLSPSMIDYSWENGRRYHRFREGQYLLPNDDKEQDRLDLMHHIFRMILNKKLHAAPLHNPERILDLGTGTGIWAIEMADEYPDAQIIANDLSAIQPKKVPPNVTFEVDDCESLWPYSKPFDFVHARTLTGAIQDWPALYKQAFANLKPGGWMEATDLRLKTYCIDKMKPDAICRQLSTLFHRAVEMVGRMPDVAQLHKGMMIDAGFVNVQERIIHIPQNTWPEDKNQKVLGAYLMYSIIDAIPSYGIAALTRILGMPRVEAEVLIAAAKNEVQDTRNRFYSIAHIVIGQRPEENTGHGF